MLPLKCFFGIIVAAAVGVMMGSYLVGGALWFTSRVLWYLFTIAVRRTVHGTVSFAIWALDPVLWVYRFQLWFCKPQHTPHPFCRKSNRHR